MLCKIMRVIQSPVAGGNTALILMLIHVSLSCQPLYLPPLEDDHRDRDYTEELRQIIVPSYQFPCHGLVTSWAACVDPGGSMNFYEMHFQVWRPQPEDGEGCFSLVGVNIPADLLEPEDRCVSYVVPQGEEIRVAPGDVIGFYVDRFQESRGPGPGGDDIEDVTRGGIQLDPEGLPSVEVLTGYAVPSLAVGGEWCREPAQLLENSLGLSPVIEAIVAPVEPSTTSINNPSTTSSIGPPKLGIKPSTSTINSLTTSIINPTTTFIINPTTTSIINPTITAASNTLTTSIINPVSMATSVSAPSTTSIIINSSATATKGTSSIIATPSSPTPLVSLPANQSEHSTSLTIITTVTSSPNVARGNPSNEGELPLLLKAGLFISGIMLLVIIALTVILMVMCCTHTRSKEKKAASSQGGDMEYCQAYVLNKNVNNMLPGVPMVWNRAYSQCTILDPPKDKPSSKEQDNSTCNWPKDMTKIRTQTHISHEYEDVPM